MNNQEFAPGEAQGFLLVNKPLSKTSFSLVSALRKCLGVKKIGHAGTLDPAATGVMVMLIGKAYTKLSDRLLMQDKEYQAVVHLGISTDSYDAEGKILATSDYIPSEKELTLALESFQGTILQVPPMFSAKKIGGKKLYELARKGKEVERPAVEVTLKTTLLSYSYPHATLLIHCSKGTYIRSVAHDLGQALGCGGHLSSLQRLRSGPFCLHDCIDGELLFDPKSHRQQIYQALKNENILKHCRI
jgi:tRNA pseudouridine55 synthase